MSYDVELRWSARGRLADMEQFDSPTRLPESFCFLVSKTDGRPAQPALDYLTSAYLSGVRVRALKVAKNTIKAVVDDLADFHHFLDANKLLVADVGEEVLERYLRSMTDTCSPVTGRPYEKATIIRRRSSVTRFLKYAQEQGFLKHRFKTEVVSTPRGTYARFAPNLPAPQAEPVDKLVRAIHPSVLTPLLDECGAALVRSVDDHLIIETHPSRLRLMAEICLQCGLRRSEVCDLQLSHFERINTANRADFSTVAVEITGKGGKMRRVPFPVWLLKAIRNYVDNVRAPLVSKALKLDETATAAYLHLFVLETKRAGALGAHVTPKKFNSDFAQARNRMLNRLRAGDQAVLEIAKYSRLTVHALRHTFALLTFILRRGQGDPCPAKYVQSVLGHRYQDTTERVYLRSSHVYESEVAQVIERREARNAI